MLDTPILFLLFNREHESKLVFERIREVQPKFLYLAADGPRKNRQGEAEKCEATRNAILSMIDWECKVYTLFRDENLGCGRAVCQAIDWFFGNEKFGIILEDDCRADPSFFWYCEELLNKYQEDDEIFLISGFNEIGSYKSGKGDYFYSDGSIWGWASWERAWSKNIFDVDYWASLEEKSKIQFRNKNIDIDRIVLQMMNKELDTWAYPWYFSRVLNNAVSISPTKNLIENIGFNSEATHTTSSQFENPKLHSLGKRRQLIPVTHKKTVDTNFYSRIDKKSKPSFFKRLKQLISRKYNEIFGN